MADYFEQDEVTRRFDSRLVARLLSWTKPYRKLMALILLALAVSTLGELALPLVVQRIVDNAILANFKRARAELGELAVEGAPVIQGWRYVHTRELKAFSRARQRELESLGTLDARSWYLVGIDERSLPVIDARAGLFEREGSWAAIPLPSLELLSRAERQALRGQDLLYVSWALAIFLGALVIVLVSTFAQTMLASWVSHGVMKDLRQELYSHGLHQSLAALGRHPVGRLVTRMTGDVETINEFFTSVATAFIKDLSIMLGVLATLWFLSPALAVAMIATLPPVVAATLVSRVKARDAFRRQRTASSRLNAFLSERLAGMQVVQLFTREGETGKEFSRRDAELLQSNLGEMLVFATFRPLIDFFSSFTLSVVIATGAWLLSGGQLSLGVLIAFINLVQMFYSPVQDIAEKYTLLQSAMAGAERVFAFLDADDRIPDGGTLPAFRPHGDISFDRICFSYKQGEPILKELSFEVKRGEMVAIVGPTGAGKSTIINLLTRLWDVDSGCIRIDGVPVQDQRLDELRTAVLPVMQDVFLFSMSVADNIRLGLPLSDEEVIAAAKAVHADEIIRMLPQGYDTILSEGATNISSGQRQLVSFARVIAHNPAIVVLDEATSSVDSETERLIQQGLERVLSGRTSIVIAHRLSTIRHADRILVLSAGVLAEQGSHEELLRKDGLYALLYRTQYAHAASGQAEGGA